MTLQFPTRLLQAAWISFLSIALLLAAAPAQAALTVTPITWDIVGLDHNRPLTSGPELFPLGARVCSDIDATDVEVQLEWLQASSFINTRPGSQNLLIFDIDADECRCLFRDPDYPRHQCFRPVPALSGCRR